MMLTSGIANARYKLQAALPAYAAGALAEPHHPHTIAALFRQLGVCRLLTEGVAEPLFVAQMQSASAYLYGLRTMRDDDKVTSLAGAWWDAIGGECWDAVAEISEHSRPAVNPAWEHEDDFLYVWFLMSRYARRPAASRPELRKLLDRWTAVLEGAHDPRHSLCDALLRGDAMAFRAAFIEVADAREAELRQQVEDRALPEEHAAWYFPFWGEGLALLRLAERDGLATDEHCAMVPQVTRAHSPFVFDAQAWRRVDHLPRRSA